MGTPKVGNIEEAVYYVPSIITIVFPVSGPRKEKGNKGIITTIERHRCFVPVVCRTLLLCFLFPTMIPGRLYSTHTPSIYVRGLRVHHPDVAGARHGGCFSFAYFQEAISSSARRSIWRYEPSSTTGGMIFTLLRFTQPRDRNTTEFSWKKMVSTGLGKVLQL